MLIVILAEKTNYMNCIRRSSALEYVLFYRS